MNILSLNGDLLTLILANLSFNTIRDARCVCKKWRTLIKKELFFYLWKKINGYPIYELHNLLKKFPAYHDDTLSYQFAVNTDDYLVDNYDFCIDKYPRKVFDDYYDNFCYSYDPNDSDSPNECCNMHDNICDECDHCGEYVCNCYCLIFYKTCEVCGQTNVNAKYCTKVNLHYNEFELHYKKYIIKIVSGTAGDNSFYFAVNFLDKAPEPEVIKTLIDDIQKEVLTDNSEIKHEPKWYWA